VTDSLTEAAPAKVNLYLHVTGRRADGYHLLDSLVVFAGAGDMLKGASSDALSLSVEGPFAAGLSGEPDNLVLRAARALAAEAGIPARAQLILHKNLPVASGIGGGSADAAAALRLLGRLWNLRLAPEALARLAVALGADVPVCLTGRATRMSGIGEQLAAAPRLPKCGILLVSPGVAVATADVFRARRGEWSSPAQLAISWPDTASMVDNLRPLRNDLEPPAVARQPVIGRVLSVLATTPGCRLARMSGSGATCFGLFDTDTDAAHAATEIRHRGWWCWGGALAPGTADFT